MDDVGIILEFQINWFTSLTIATMYFLQITLQIESLALGPIGNELKISLNDLEVYSTNKSNCNRDDETICRVVKRPKLQWNKTKDFVLNWCHERHVAGQMSFQAKRVQPRPNAFRLRIYAKRVGIGQMRFHFYTTIIMGYYYS